MKLYTESILIVKYKALNDQYECDAERIPLKIVSFEEAEKNYQGDNYEWYIVYPDGELELI
jgi:hypothetical protein